MQRVANHCPIYNHTQCQVWQWNQGTIARSTTTHSAKSDSGTKEPLPDLQPHTVPSLTVEPRNHCPIYNHTQCQVWQWNQGTIARSTTIHSAKSDSGTKEPLPDLQPHSAKSDSGTKEPLPDLQPHRVPSLTVEPRNHCLIYNHTQCQVWQWNQGKEGKRL